MKLLRYGPRGQERPGVLGRDGVIHDLSRELPDLTPEQLIPDSLRSLSKLDPGTLPAVGGEPRLGVPVAGIRKFIAVGLNYADHARETGKELPKEPLFWLKATTSLIPDGGKIEIPFRKHRTDYEAELAIVIGRRIRNVTPTSASRYIFGYTTAEDISDRTIQNSESQWARCKSFDTFTPLGPYVETKIDPNELTIQLFQNGQLRQNSNTKQLIFKPAELVSFISTNLTLLPGDVILTGTPSGIGPIQSGDRLEVRIQGLAPLVNQVK